MVSRPILTTGVALAGAAAIVAATPAIIPNETEKTYVTTASVPECPMGQLSVADYQLMAVTLPGLLQAFFNGYGQEVTEDTLVLGPLGALYYLLDQGVLAEVDVDDHFFEEGPYAAAGHLARQAGLPELAEFLEGPWVDLRESIVELAHALTGGGLVDLDDIDPDEDLTFPARLVHAFLHNGGPLGVIRVIVDEINDAFNPEETEAVVTEHQAAGEGQGLPGTEGPDTNRLDPGPVEQFVQRDDEPAAAGAPSFNPAAGLKITSFLPKKPAGSGLEGLAGAIKNFDSGTPQQAPAPQVEIPEPEVEPPVAAEDSGEPTKTKAQLRHEVFQERWQERREAAKERAQERREAIKDRVNDAVQRVTGRDSQTDDTQTGDDGGADNKNDGADPGE